MILKQIYREFLSFSHIFYIILSKITCDNRGIILVFLFIDNLLKIYLLRLFK